MSHARIEEVSDSDPEEMDPDEMDIEDVERELMSFDENHPAAAVTSASTASSSSKANESIVPPQARPQPSGPTKELLAERQRQREAIKKWQCLYPVYFDANRTREEGRRVKKDLAVENPLAREIWDAANSLGLQVAFEPEKTHPKDWANPGRVRVALKDAGSGTTIKNKHHLYIRVAEYLKQHPTTTESPLRLRLPGMPATAKPPPSPAVPKGWKLGSILPFHSAAVSGGGVSENIFKELMGSMGGDAEAAAPAVEQSAQKQKRPKQKIIRA
ncbi:hypothetical protein FH972_025017 [Carpinus fangiana]|uniref:Signal recognition particle SRP19 subunit n=1 Tax=Carpinus fangiana TaxID=176857 RepID=A0A5N6L0P8_9ROSI|nr:hypothetical protein FH972_025017 [Carpinus fangiana]